MDYNEVVELNDSVVIKGVKNFNIKQILECGQCFRWQKITDTDYIVVSNRRVIEIGTRIYFCLLIYLTIKDTGSSNKSFKKFRI